jgi:hypothetical protein
MKGYAREQINDMDSYNHLLVELGEKNYVTEESQWSVEVRLISLVLMNAAAFVAMKMIGKNLGVDSSNINLDNLSGNESNQPPPSKMSGPEI